MSTYKPKVGDFIFTPEKLAEHDAEVCRATVKRIRALIDAGEVVRDEDDPEDEGDVSYGRIVRILEQVLDAGPYWGNNGGTGAAILDDEAAR